MLITIICLRNQYNSFNLQYKITASEKTEHCKQSEAETPSSIKVIFVLFLKILVLNIHQPRRTPRTRLKKIYDEVSQK